MNSTTSGQNENELWFKIAKLRPKIRKHISISRQEFHDEIWYVYQDLAANRFHRFNYSSHQFISMMNGEHCINDIWKLLKKKQNDIEISQDDILQLLGNLHRSDLLQTNLQVDTQDLYRRTLQKKQQRWKTLLRNPLSFRISLFDPEKLLTYTLPVIKPLFTKFFLSVWLIVIIAAVLLTGSYWDEISNNSLEQAFSPQNILLFIAIYPFIKLFHELGHAFAVKYWGGEVHDIGIIFMLFFPIPYVDASGASAFSYKYQRIIVGAAGIMVESFIACIALFVWLGVEPGIIRTIAFDTILVAGISTLFFNGNPLLRYDGYYVLSDATSIPNLASRSNKYIGYLIQRYIFGINQAKSPAYNTTEQYWFFCYSPASFFYRMAILFIIILIVADQSIAIGALLGFWILYNQILLPLFNHAKFVLFDTITLKKRTQAVTTTVGVAFSFMAILFALPFPLTTIAEGVTWLPDDAIIYSQTTGFVKEIHIENDKHVVKGEILLVLEDPLLVSRIKILNAQLQELTTQYNESWSTKRVKNRIIKEQIYFLKEKIQQFKEKSTALIIKSPKNGKIIIPNLQDLKGQYFNKGDFIAYIISPATLIARVVIKQHDIGLFDEINSVNAMYSGNTEISIIANVIRILPETNHRLPSASLGTMGGGNIDIDVLDESGLKTIDKVQQIEIELYTDNNSLAYIGKRIYVRFDHGTAPLAQQWFKSLQQLFLARFSV